MITNREVIGNILNELIKKNKQNIFVLDADVCNATGTNFVKEKNPYNFIQCGICEQHMFNLACGLSLSNNIVFIGTLSIFVLRALEQLRNYICLGNLNIKIIGTHVGLATGEDGVTHQTLEDIGVLKSIPNISIFSCSSNISIQKIIELSYELKGPVYIRISRQNIKEMYSMYTIFKKNMYHLFTKNINANCLILTHGIMLEMCLQFQQHLYIKYDKHIDVVDLYCLKPIDDKMLKNLIKKYTYILTIEDHFIIGGLSDIITRIICQYNLNVTFFSMGVDDEFGYSAPAQELFDLQNLNIPYLEFFFKQNIF